VAVGRRLEIPDLDDLPVYDLYIANRWSAAVAVAVHVGLFDWMTGREVTILDVAEHFGWSERGAESLATVLASLGLLDREGERLRPTARAEAFLAEGRPGSLGGLVTLEFDHFMTPDSLLKTLRDDRNSVYGDEDVWARHERDPERARTFTIAMHSISTRPALGLAAALDLSDRKCVLDMGGGSGVHLVAMLQRWPHLRGILVEIGSVCPVAAEVLAEHGVLDRVDVQVGDMFSETWPTGADVVLLSQMIHDWRREVGVEFLKAAYRALPAGGMVLVHEKLVHDDRRGPATNAAVGLDMLMWTDGRQYSGREVAEMMAEAGFGPATVTPTVGYWSVVAASR
jgi:acetylserotonin N-methyltransferase